MAINKQDDVNKNALTQCKIYQTVFADVISTRYYGVPEDMAYDHEKDVYKGIRKKIHGRLNLLLCLASDYVVGKQYEDALNHYVDYVFPETLRLIADVEMAILKASKKRKAAQKIEKSEEEVEFSATPIIDEEVRLKQSLLSLPEYFYKMLNEQIHNLIEHSKKCKIKNKDVCDGSFLKTQMAIRTAELFRGQYSGVLNKKRSKYAGEYYRYLISRVVYTSWKTFLYVYSLNTGNGLLALKEDKWYRLDDYLNGKGFSVSNSKAVSLDRLAINTEVSIEGIVSNVLDEEMVDEVSRRYHIKSEPDDEVSVEDVNIEK